MSDSNNPAGLYIHIPFCKKKCIYCDFYSINDFSFAQEFIVSLKNEINEINSNFIFDTIYIGGGTPSVLNSNYISDLIETVYKKLSFSRDVEITIEVNPGTLNIQKLKDYKSFGINRINIGIQSFHNNNLKFLERIHSEDEAIASIEMAKKTGFENIGIDLIYGIPSQTLKEWEFDLKHAIEFNPNHISCYMLTFESGTMLDNRRISGDIKPLEDSTLCDMFNFTIEFLKDNGYIHYEISNFAESETKKSKHNTKYWSFVPYIGLGPSAHSFNGKSRWWNIKSVYEYINMINKGQKPIQEKETLDREQSMLEAIYLGLRVSEGINISYFNDSFNMNFSVFFKNIIDNLEKKQLVSLDDNFCRLTQKGMLFLDSITGMFT
ncbi:MAG: radical SAM family heme chaperone HemW [Desulfobacterales bacterium]|nr:radical SAM family heme chaperone HemW [Desulfobacterales bacterium]